MFCSFGMGSVICFSFGCLFSFWSLLPLTVTTLDCLPDAVPVDRRGARGLGSRNFTMGVAAGVWVSQEITSRIIRILIQERLGIHVDFYFAPAIDFPVVYAWIAGCNAAHWDCADFNASEPAFDMFAEYWIRADASTLYLKDYVDKVDPEAFLRVVNVGSLGYMGSSDVFLWARVIDEAYNATGLSLDWWLDLQRREAITYFTSYKKLNITYGVYQWCSYFDHGVEVNHSERSKLESLGYACNSSEQYNNPYRKTRDGMWDANGEYPVKVFPVLDCTEAKLKTPNAYDQYVALGYKCVADGWFISPPCVAKSPGDEWMDACLLVFTFSPDDPVAQVASLALLPVSVGTIAIWDAYDEFIYDTAEGFLKRGDTINNVVFEWWTPDNTMGARYPKVSSASLVRRKINFEDGMNTIPYSFTTAMNEHVYAFAPEVSQFVDNFKISVTEMNWMLNTFPTFINDTFDIYDAENRIACDWVRLHEAKWSAWVGRESCKVNTYFNSENRLCIDCPSGTVSKRQAQGIESCIPCEPGKVFEAAISKCAPCGFGRFANHSQSLTSCVMCKKGSYADSIGASACKFCPDHFTTSDIEALSMGDCVCAEDAYLSSPRVCSVCPLGRAKPEEGSSNISSCHCLQGSYLRRGDVTCSACPEGLECAFASDDATHLPMPARGYWVAASRPFDVYLCRCRLCCPGGGPNTCNPNHDPSSIGCASCVEHSYLDSTNNCRRCEGTTVWPIAIAAIVATIVFLAMHVLAINRDFFKIQNDALTVASIVGLTFSALQALGVFNGLKVQITEPIKSIFAAMQFLTLDIRVLKMACIVGNGVLTTFIIQELIAPVGVGIIGLIILLWKCFHPEISVKVAFTNTVGHILTVFFISIVASSISPFINYKHPGDSGWSVQSLPSVLMFSPIWNSLVIISAASFTFMTLPFTAMVFYGCYMYPRFITRSGYSQQLKMYRFLYLRFKQEAYYYGSAIVFRNLVLCLVPALIQDDSVASIVILSTLLLVSLVTQATLQPWKLPATNRLDSALTVGLQLVLVIVAATMGGSAREASVEAMSYMVVIVCVMGATASFVYVFYRYLKPNPWYHFFICHHKVGAAAQSRYLKLLIIQLQSSNVFIDSDNLSELDGLFDTIKCRVGHFIVFLTKRTLARPWCCGEIVTAFKTGLKTTKLIGTDFVTLAEHDYANLEGYVKNGGIVLAKYLIALTDIDAAYRWLLSSTVPGMRRSGSLCGLRHYDHFVSEFLGIRHVQPRSTMSPDPVDGVIFSADSYDVEAIASIGIMVLCIRVKFLHMSAGSLIILSDFDSDRLTDEVITDWIAKAKASIVILSVHSLTSSQQLLVICRSVELAARPEGNLVLPVTSPTFVFPTDNYLEDLLPAIQRFDVPCDQRVELVKRFFNTIAVNLSTHASQTIISAQCDEVLRRLNAKPSSQLLFSNESSRPSQRSEEWRVDQNYTPKLYFL